MTNKNYTIDDFTVLKDSVTGSYNILSSGEKVSESQNCRILRPQKWPADVMCVVISYMISSHSGLNFEAVKLPYAMRESMQLCGYSDRQIQEVLFSTMCKISDNNAELGGKKYGKHLYSIQHLN